MNAIATDIDTGSAATTTVGESRWGVRLQELSAAEVAPIVEPLEWKPKPRLWQRLRRGLAVPATAAAIIFIAIVLVSVTMVWMRPHTLDSTQMTEAAAEAPLSAQSGGTANQPLTTGAEQSGGASAAEPSPKLPVLVHVVGEVKQPGVYDLAEGSRVLAAIEAAGGPTDAAALQSVNLARLLIDGEQLIVPNAEAVELATSTGALTTPIPGSTATTDGLVSLNSADQATLETLPRVGPALAQRIIAWRSDNGGFQSTDQLLNVSGIGQKTFEQLKDLLTL